MRREIHAFVQTRLTDFSDCRTAADMELTSIGALKTIVSEVLLVAQEQREARREILEALAQLQRRSPSELNISNFNQSIENCISTENSVLLEPSLGASSKAPATAPLKSVRQLSLDTNSSAGGNDIIISRYKMPILDSGTSNGDRQHSKPEQEAMIPNDDCDTAGLELEPWPVVSAIDGVAMEMSGLVSGFCRRAADISDYLASSPRSLRIQTTSAAPPQGRRIYSPARVNGTVSGTTGKSRRTQLQPLGTLRTFKFGQKRRIDGDGPAAPAQGPGESSSLPEDSRTQANRDLYDAGSTVRSSSTASTVTAGNPKQAHPTITTCSPSQRSANNIFLNTPARASTSVLF